MHKTWLYYWMTYKMLPFCVLNLSKIIVDFINNILCKQVLKIMITGGKFIFSWIFILLASFFFIITFKLIIKIESCKKKWKFNMYYNIFSVIVLSFVFYFFDIYFFNYHIIIYWTVVFSQVRSIYIYIKEGI